MHIFIFIYDVCTYKSYFSRQRIVSNSYLITYSECCSLGASVVCTQNVRMCIATLCGLLQTVAASDLGMLVSVFDGSTPYNLGRTMTAKRGLSAWAPMDACYFVYKTKEQVHI